jgi:hypothetical protein
MFGENNSVYSQRIIQIIGESFLSYYLLDETSGTNVIDIKNGRNGTSSGLALANVQSPNNKPCPLFATSSITLPAAFKNAFTGAEGAIGGFAKVTDAGVWEDATARYLAYISADANNNLLAGRETTALNNTFQFLYKAGGTQENTPYYMNNSGWFHWMLSWSKANERMIGWINGARASVSLNLGTWAGTPATALLGHNGGTLRWHGWMSDVFSMNREPTDAEARQLSTAFIRPLRISILGDSISTPAPGLLTYQNHLANLGYNGGWVGIINHAANGATIAANLAGQVTAAASDNADKIIIHAGTNDNNAGDMGALQTIVQTAIDNLRISNPSAAIYFMNVLPRWTDIGGGTPVDKGNIRTAIAAACTAKNIPCWDTFTSPLIAAANTGDGLHPTAAIQLSKVAPFVFARLT